MSAQMYDKIIFNKREYGLAATPLEGYFAAKPEFRPKFASFNTGCARGYIAQWEVRDERLYLVGMDMICDTHATFSSIFPDAHNGVFAEWVNGQLLCPYGKMIKYDHAGFGSVKEHELILEIENGILKSSTIKDN